MAEESRDPKTPKAEADKKVPETVLLTAEELRAIAGGAKSGHTLPPAAKVMVADPKHKPNAVG